jgi:hypothetical protein
MNRKPRIRNGNAAGTRHSLRRILSIGVMALCLLASLLVTSMTPAIMTHSDAAPDGQWLYRVDTTGPNQIFEHGFASYSANSTLPEDTNLVNHVLGSSLHDQTSAYISMTRDPDFAVQWITDGLSRPVDPALTGQEQIFWVYQIRPTGDMIDTMASLRATDDAEARAGEPSYDPWRNQINSAIYAFEYQDEVDAVRTVPNTLISSVTQYVRDLGTGTVTPADPLPNPAYHPGAPVWPSQPYLVARPAALPSFSFWSTSHNATDGSTSRTAGLTFCDYPGSASSPTSGREKRSLTATPTGCADPIAHNFVESEVPAYDSKRSAQVYISTTYPWKSHTTDNHYYKMPDVCDNPKNNNNSLVINCSSNPFFSRYRLRASAGPSGTFFAHTYDGTTYTRLVKSADSIVCTECNKQNESLDANSYDIAQVFFKEGFFELSWWSRLVIEPVFG